MAFLPQTRWRQLHRWVVPIAAAPLLMTAATGSLYSLLLERGIDAFWLIQIHAGRFGPLNLQPYYSGLLGLFTLVVIVSGAGLLAFRGRAKGHPPSELRP
jgi:uncharacterized iron-regulated membrane protein